MVHRGMVQECRVQCVEQCESAEWPVSDTVSHRGVARGGVLQFLQRLDQLLRLRGISTAGGAALGEPLLSVL